MSGEKIVKKKCDTVFKKIITLFKITDIPYINDGNPTLFAQLKQKKYFVEIKNKLDINNKIYVFYSNKNLKHSLRYRIYNIREGLSKKNIISEVVYEDEEYKFNILKPYIKILIVFRSFNQYFDRFILPSLKKDNFPIIFDIDDYVFEPTNINYFGWIESNVNIKERKRHILGLKMCQKMIKSYDYGTTTTQYLTNKMSKLGLKTKVIRNTINFDQYRLSKELNKRKKNNRDIIKICYLSGTNTHNKDFREFEDALEILLAKYKKIEFHIVGFLTLNKKFTKYSKRIIRQEFMPYLGLLKYLSKMDINIAPLELNNPFTAGKSELKIFEAALVKVPSVVSPVDSYSKCITNKVNGFLAKNTKEWVEYLSLLIENKKIRQKIANKAYSDFTKIFYIENNIKQIINIYDSFIKDKQNDKQRSNR